MKTRPLIALMLACGSAVSLVVVEPPSNSEPAPPCCKEGLPPMKFSEKSLYGIEAAWTADVGREVKLGALRGRPQVMALFFTNCEYSCPLIVKDMKAIERALPPDLRGKVDFLLVSIDPARDTPEVLRAFRVKYDLPIEHWSLLRGEKESVQKLAEMVGFRYLPGGNQQYAHSLLISVLNQSGEIVYQEAGVGNLTDGPVKVLQRLVNSRAAGPK